MTVAELIQELEKEEQDSNVYYEDGKESYYLVTKIVPLEEGEILLT